MLPFTVTNPAQPVSPASKLPLTVALQANRKRFRRFRKRDVPQLDCLFPDLGTELPPPNERFLKLGGMTQQNYGAYLPVLVPSEQAASAD